MKRSSIALLFVFFLLVPLTLLLGSMLPGRSYYITGTLIMVEMLVPFFMMFEGRKPQARELVLVAVLCAIAIVSRAAVPLPHFKPTFAIIMLAGVAFGPEVGFMVGAVAAFGSNFFAGQGAYTPWQMMAFGSGGLAAGFLAQRGWLSRKPWALSAFGFVACVLWVGPLLDLSSVFLMLSYIDPAGVLARLLAGLPVNVAQGVCTVITMVLFSRPLLEKLDRIKRKYGMMEHDPRE